MTYLIPAARPSADSSRRPGPHGLEHLLSARLADFQRLLSSIDIEIQARLALTERIGGELLSEIGTLRNDLLLLEAWPPGTNAAVDARRHAPEQRVALLSEQERAQPVRCWQDIAPLTRERRHWLKDYWDLAHRLTLLGAYTRNLGRGGPP